MYPLLFYGVFSCLSFIEFADDSIFFFVRLLKISISNKESKIVILSTIFLELISGIETFSLNIIEVRYFCLILLKITSLVGFSKFSSLVIFFSVFSEFFFTKNFVNILRQSSQSRLTSPSYCSSSIFYLIASSLLYI